MECRSLLKQLANQNKTIAFQWVPSHIGVFGNEMADELAKKGTRTQTTFHFKPNFCKKIEEVKKAFQLEHTLENLEVARGKTRENIAELAAEVKNKGRKEAAAKFRLSGHDCLGHHLHTIGVY